MGSPGMRGAPICGTTAGRQALQHQPTPDRYAGHVFRDHIKTKGEGWPEKKIKRFVKANLRDGGERGFVVTGGRQDQLDYLKNVLAEIGVPHGVFEDEGCSWTVWVNRLTKKFGVLQYQARGAPNLVRPPSES